jgi:hypothetical protein
MPPLPERIRHTQKYRQWRRDVLTRDEWRCVKCGRRSRGLQADHYPTPLASLLRMYSIDSLAKAFLCRALWRLDNGRALCARCHALEERRVR